MSPLSPTHDRQGLQYQCRVGKNKKIKEKQKKNYLGPFCPVRGFSQGRAPLPSCGMELEILLWGQIPSRPFLETILFHDTSSISHPNCPWPKALWVHLSPQKKGWKRFKVRSHFHPSTTNIACEYDICTMQCIIFLTKWLIGSSDCVSNVCGSLACTFWMWASQGSYRNWTL